MKNLEIKPNAVLKDYWRNNERFADLFNQVFFHGEALLASDNLTDKDAENSTVIMERKKMTSLSRAGDLIKQYAGMMEVILIGMGRRALPI